MATTHVFIVDEQTFPVHLKYMFAGIGKTQKYDEKTPILNLSFNLKECLESKAYIGMIQDISRIRIGDEVFFYVCKTQKSEGEFFGVFEVVQDGNEQIPFAFESNDSDNSLAITNELKKTLQFRVKISPKTVYEKGVSEIQLLDSFTEKTRAKDLCWSLIYRKLKGARGCTPITELESKKLKDGLEKINNRKELKLSDDHSFDFKDRKITTTGLIERNGNFALSHIKLESELKEFIKGNISEGILQTYILSSDDILKKFVDSGSKIVWIGNEVFCSFGNSQIDILIVSEKNNKYAIYPIELKKAPLAPKDKEQILKYKNWCSIHKNSFVPASANRTKIVPILVTKQYAQNARKTAIDNKEEELKKGKIKHYIFDENLNIDKYIHQG